MAGYNPSEFVGDNDNDEYRYSAPEVQSPEDFGMDKILFTEGSDVYGMAMITYEARSHRPTSYNLREALCHLGLNGGKAVQ